MTPEIRALQSRWMWNHLFSQAAVEDVGTIMGGIFLLWEDMEGNFNVRLLERC